MPTQESFLKYLRVAFYSVVTRYQEFREKRKYDCSPDGRGKPCISDFIADVEICARKELNPKQLTYFKDAYLEEFGVDDFEIDGEVIVDRDLKEVLGKAFLETGLFPVGPYFKYVKRKAHEKV